MELKAGTRLRSAVCATEVIVTRAPADAVELGCGGAAMIGIDESASGAEPDGELMSGTLLGKRYADEERGLEVLCTAGGEGSLTLDGRPLGVNGAKPLPSSD